MRGVRGYHQAYLGHFLINGKKPTPPLRLEMNEYNIAKIEYDILEAYKNINSSSYSVLKSAFAKIYSIFNDGIEFFKQLNGVMIRTLNNNLIVKKVP